MPSIDGLNQYIGRAQGQEKIAAERILEDLHKLLITLYPDEDTQPRLLPFFEKLLELRNISRDVGWMRRLRADLKKEGGWDAK
jgi:hypothetical protein